MFFSRHSSPILFPTSSAAPCNMGTSISDGTSDFHARNVRQYGASNPLTFQILGRKGPEMLH